MATSAQTKLAAAIIGVLLGGTVEAGRVLYVDDSAPAGGDGETWSTAYRFLQDALAAAGSGGVSEIRVAEGTYLPDRDEANPAGTGDSAATFQLLDGVVLAGGYAGLPEPDPDARDVLLYETSLSGDIAAGGFASDCCTQHVSPGCDDPDCQAAVCAVYDGCCWYGWDSYCASKADELCGALCSLGDSFHVVTASGTDATAVLDGFTITDGRADAGPANPGGQGGGLVCAGGSPVIANCTFRQNHADGKGGAIYDDLASALTIIDCTFVDNTGWFGGALANVQGSSPVLISCTFSGNGAKQGGGVYNDAASPQLEACAFQANHADQGGAVADRAGSATALFGCTFSQNSANRGGAMDCVASNPVLTDCLFAENGESDYNFYGGALACIDGTTAVLTHCQFVANSASVGGGIYNASSGGVLADCTFSDNTTQYGAAAMFNGWGSDPVLISCAFSGNDANIFPGGGGGMHNLDSSPTLLGCTFIANSSNGQGAGIYDSFDSNPLIAGCSFVNNSAYFGGSGMSADGGSATLIHCRFIGNSGQNAGGGVKSTNSSLALFGCLFAGNTAFSGGGMYCDYNAPTRLVNCTFTENTAALGSAGLHDQALQAIVTNCIFWANSTPGGSGYSAEVNTAYSGLVTYCCIEGYFVPELFHNFGDDPLFLDPDGPDDDPATFDDNDYRLSAGSPCIDAGVNWAVAPDAADLDGDGDTAELVPLDLGGSARFADDPLSDDSGCGVPAVVDIGAHEFRGQPFEVRLGDIDGDGSVGILDFLGLLVNWGPCAQECCLADLDLDGQVGIADFRLLVGNWG